MRTIIISASAWSILPSLSLANHILVHLNTAWSITDTVFVDDLSRQSVVKLTAKSCRSELRKPQLKSDDRAPESNFHASIHVSYSNITDHATACLSRWSNSLLSQDVYQKTSTFNLSMRPQKVSLQVRNDFRLLFAIQKNGSLADLHLKSRIDTRIYTKGESIAHSETYLTVT